MVLSCEHGLIFSIGMLWQGLTYNVRKEAWKFLLGYFPWDSTEADRVRILREKRDEYEIYKNQWKSITPAQAANFEKFRERLSRVEKDVIRTDRTTTFFARDDDPNLRMLHDILMSYAFFNFDTGYCQVGWILLMQSTRPRFVISPCATPCRE